MLERDLGYPCTSMQMFDSKTSDDVSINLHEFGSTVLVIMQRNLRISDMDSLMSGSDRERDREV